MSRVRQPAVAGVFYPADPDALGALLVAYLAEARTGAAGDANEPLPKALVVPHAGYVYSGPIAASAYVQLERERQRVERVVLLGPSHRVALEGLAVPSADRFATPLGDIVLDRVALDRALALPQVSLCDAAHEAEHSLEVQLPFLQRVLGDFVLVPFAVGDATGAQVAELLELLWNGPETLILVSSDLSHYRDYETARSLDTATSRAIEELAPDRLDFESACGRVPLRGLLLAARRHGLRARLLDLRSSGDTAGPRDRVVGYGAYRFA